MKTSRFRPILYLALLALLIGFRPVEACTFFMIKANDKSIVTGRSMEFATDVATKLDLVPRGTSFESAAPKGDTPTQWRNSLGFIAMSHNGDKFYSDGLNEKGLAVSVQWFSEGQYPTPAPGVQTIKNDDVGGWILGNFSTVEEVKAALGKATIYGAKNAWIGIVLQFHWAITDAKGNTIVVEPVDGKIQIHENSENAVMTNEPPLPWHLMNLRRFSAVNPQRYNTETALAKPGWARGSGMMALPGDYTSPSRFTRISILKDFAKKSQNADEAVNTAIHLLNNVDYVPGVDIYEDDPIGNDSKGPVFRQYTPWVTIADLTGRRYFYRTSDSQNIRAIDLKKVNFAEGQPYRSIPIYNQNAAIDDTDRLVSAAGK